MTAAPLDTALAYIDRGWNPVPVPFKTKAPKDKGWEQRIITRADVCQHFNGEAQNIGVVLGPSSSGLTDIDLDCAEAIALAPFLLPRTDAIFGRRSKPASHWLYSTALGETARNARIVYKLPGVGGEVLFELRIGGKSGAQTVFPGSVHETGEAIEWTKAGDPTKVDGSALHGSVAALACGCLLVRGWPGKGGRHDAALVLGGFLARAGLDDNAIHHFVGAVAAVAGDDQVADRQKAALDQAAAFRAGKNAFGWPALKDTFGEATAKLVAEWLGYKGDQNSKAAPADPIGEAQELDGGAITQDGVARVFAKRYAERLRYDHDAGKWYEWTGARWRRDQSARAFAFVRAISREVSEGAKESVLKEVRRITFAGGVEKFAQCDPILAVTSELWDADPWLLGTPGGTVDLRTGQTREPDPGDHITKLTKVAPADTADCPLWLRFLGETFGGNAETIRFVQQWCGYSLTGITREHALVFGYGAGGNGKGVFINVITGIANDYAATAAMDTFTASTFASHPADLAMLRGARIVTASETEEGRAWAEARIKALTGGDKITARFMRQDFFTFDPTFKLLIIGNHKPALRNVDDAARRRFNLLPFLNKPASPDPTLEDKLRAEWPGILRWMIEGCLDWQRNGLVRPPSVVEATADYFSDQDLFSQWLDEDCDVELENEHKWEAVRDLYEKWTEFANAGGEKPGTIKSFSNDMQKRGFKRCRKGAVKVTAFARIRLHQRKTSREAA